MFFLYNGYNVSTVIETQIPLVIVANKVKQYV